MWLENLKLLKKQSGLSSKQIAERTNLPERTVCRIFSGETDNPYVDTLYRIVVVLNGSLDDILADTKAVVGHSSLKDMQEEIDKLRRENEMLRLQISHKEELLAVHQYYQDRNRDA